MARIATFSVTRDAPSESHGTLVGRTRARATSLASEGPGILEKDTPVVFSYPNPLPPVRTYTSLGLAGSDTWRIDSLPLFFQFFIFKIIKITFLFLLK